MTAPTSPRTLPLLKATQTLVATVTGKPCGLMRIPRVEDVDRLGNQTKPVDPPYAVVYPTPGGGSLGAAWGNEGSARTVPVQVSCVGRRGDDALWLLDRVRGGLLDTDGTGVPLHTLAAPGLVVMRRTFDSDSPPLDQDGLVTMWLRVALHVSLADTP